MRHITLGVLAVALALPLAAQQTDSPLVALAKRTGRLGKAPKAQVITNETLATSGGHVSEAVAPDDEENATKPANAGAQQTSPNAFAAADAAYKARMEKEEKTTAPRAPVVEGTARATYTTVPDPPKNTSVTSSASSSSGQSTAQNGTVQSTASSTMLPPARSTATPPAVVPPKSVD